MREWLDGYAQQIARLGSGLQRARAPHRVPTHPAIAQLMSSK
jgi:hypothetical protein